jgi:hypothetical protein
MLAGTGISSSFTGFIITVMGQGEAVTVGKGGINVTLLKGGI